MKCIDIIAENGVEDEPRFAAWELEFESLRIDKYHTDFPSWEHALDAFNSGITPSEAMILWETGEMSGGL